LLGKCAAKILGYGCQSFICEDLAAPASGCFRRTKNQAALVDTSVAGATRQHAETQSNTPIQNLVGKHLSTNIYSSKSILDFQQSTNMDQ
jgi:hypothetical protein